MEKTKQEEFEEASKDISNHCFEAGRLHYEILMDEEMVEKKKLRLRNMKRDFDKLNDVFQKKLRAMGPQAAPQAASEEPKADTSLEIQQ